VELEIPDQAVFNEAAAVIEKKVKESGGHFPDEAAVSATIGAFHDPWGSPIRYQILNSSKARLMSDGPDHKPGTRWDIGIVIDLPQPSASGEASWTDKLHPAEPWLERRKKELGIRADTSAQTDSAGFTHTAFSGGQTRLHGAAYFWFFTWLMLGTAVAFIPYALLYRPKSYLQD
jgi:POT family proton-dependent oligopeptide transporter